MNTSVPFAYLGVILIWSTTPLAVKWSGDGPGFLFGVTSRMTLGLLVALSTLYFFRLKLIWNRSACQIYLVSGLSIYASMMCIYWGAQYIPSGWIAVIFGLSPVITGVMASIWLKENALTLAKVSGLLLGIAGLFVIFGEGVALGARAVYGSLAVVISALILSTGAVWLKRANANLPAVTITAGGLLFALPLYLFTWLLVDAQWPTVIPAKAAYSILYLGIVGSVIGFSLYFYVLKHLEVSRTALIAFVTPVTALVIGNAVNQEPLTVSICMGAILILSGLLLHEFGERVLANIGKLTGTGY